jgi:Na+/H+ antiporter NhaD/arsenite permease-like protein/Tfp pilus assembly protein PilF
VGISFSFAKFKIFFVTCLVLAGFLCVLPGFAALAKNGRWPACRNASPVARIAACTEILARGSKETKRNQIAAYINRSNAYRALGDLDRAAADLGEALRLNPKSPLALIKRGSLYYEQGDLDRAIADYDAAISAKPKSAAAFYGRAEAYRAKNDLDRAIADFGSALRLDKNLAAAYGGRARAYLAKGELDKALPDFDEALSLDPNAAELYVERGAVYQAKDNLDQAIANYDRAIELDPKLAAARNDRGLAFLAKGDFAKARADFSQAVELDPKFAEAFVNRAKADRGENDLESARQDLETALKLDPQLTAVKEALDEVNKLIAGSAIPAKPAPPPASLPWPLALPFAGMLLSIAFGPLAVREWWHIHYEKAAAFWAALTLIGLAAAEGPSAAMAGFIHNMVDEYLPFILMLFALFTAAGGILIEGELRGSPLVNTIFLAVGTIMASFTGTTGASMVLIRPLIRANIARPFNAHVVVFFIFLVSNIGGALTPLGDPPLFLGYLEGVDFFWTLRALWPHTLFTAGVLLTVFFLIDSYIFLREKRHSPVKAITGPRLRVSGLVNVAFIGIAVLAIVGSGFWRPGIGFDLFGTRIELQNLIRDLVMVLAGLASLRWTSPDLRAANSFEWEPIREVAYLFAGIFICIIPVMAMIQAGVQGPFSLVIHALSHADGTPNDAVYFWTTGLLSSFLDNAPTYLVFFHLASGDPSVLMGPLAKTLTAISLGAVFMGAGTYIGNAPNFMVYAIARRAGVRMPSFFHYMLWSGAILLPVFAAVTWLFLVTPSVVPGAVAEEAPRNEASTVEVPGVKFNETTSK